MKILYTTHQFYPDYGAGTELLTYMTASQMGRLGHKVSIATGHPAKNPPQADHAFDDYTYDSIPIYRYRHASFYPVGHQCIMEAEHNNLLVKEWFYKLLKKHKPDLVHVFHLQRISASVLEVCNELKIPFIITVTDFWMICPTTQLLLPDNSLCAGPQKRMENCIKHLSSKSSIHLIGVLINKLPDSIIRGIVQFLKLFHYLRFGALANIYALVGRPDYILEQINHAKCIMVTNRFMKQKLIDNGIHSKLIKKMPFGIKAFHQPNETTVQKDTTLTIGFIGTLNYHKGAHILFKAMQEIPTSRNIQLKVYGSREQFPDYVKMLDDIAISDRRIRFEGIFQPESMGSVLHNLDVLVVPSLWYENTPLIIHQAHAAKIPVIATDLGGMNEAIIHGQNGYLFEAGNCNQLSLLIESLIEDESLVLKFRSNIEPPIFIGEYAARLEKQYRIIIDERNRNPS